MSDMDKRSAIFLDEMGIGVQWQLRQQFQMVQGQAGPSANLQAVQGRIQGATLHLWAPGGQAQTEWQMGPQGPTLRVVGASGAWTAWLGQTLQKAKGDRCTG